MKKYAYMLLLFLLVSGIATPVVASEIRVVVDGETVEFAHPPILEKNRTLVPMREIFTAIGAAVTWDDTTRTALAVVDDVQVSIPIGSNLPTVNDIPIPIDVPSMLVGNRTYIPLRFAAESLGGDVIWDASTNTAIITTATTTVTAEEEDQDGERNKSDKIDINAVGQEILAAIDGISEAVAADLLAYREANILYRSFDEIRNVPSVTDTLFDVLAEQIRIVYTDEGIGSWYGPKFHGNRTYFGEIYDMHLHTAAHPSLPLNTMVYVTFPETGRSVWVRINDRGPNQIVHPDRIIDLSLAAADLIGLTPYGIGRVKLEIVKER